MRSAALATRAAFLAIIVGGVPASSSSEELSVAQIVERSNRVAYYQGQDGRARVRMTISDGQGQTRTRAFTLLRRDEEVEGAPPDQATGEQKMYVYFRRPADVNKMVFMVWKHPGKDDDRWLYLPALDLVKRIAATDRRTSFVGSNFFYEDVSGRSPEEDDHELVKTTETYYVLRSRPKDPGRVEFDHYDSWIHHKTFLPVRTEYFDASGERYRRYEALEVESIDGFPTVVRSRMSDLRGGGNTLLEYSSVRYDLGLPEEIFTERYLRSPPIQYLR